MSAFTRFEACRGWVVAAVSAVAVSAACALTFHSADAANGSVIYTYDALGRIATSAYDTGVCIAYSYDPVGNRLSETIVIPASTDTAIWDCYTWDNAKWGP